MKKIIFIIITIFGVSCLTGCADDDYAIEKKYWHLQKQAGKIFSNPHASPPKELESVVKSLAKFVDKHWRTNLAVEADFTIARLYMIKEEYELARAQLKSMLGTYRRSAAVCSEILFLTGNSYEEQDKWDSALEQYNKILQKYPVTLRGFSVPIYIAERYKAKFQPDKMVTAFRDAIKHYKALADQFSATPVAYQSQILSAQCYMALKEWQNAIAAFKTVITDFKDKVNLDQTYINMAYIYSNELNDNVKAKETLESLLKDYPKSRLVELAKSMLKRMDKK